MMPPDIAALIQQVQKLTGDERVCFLLNLAASLAPIEDDAKAKILIAFMGEETDLVLAALLCAMTYNTSKDSYAKQKTLAHLLCKNLPKTTIHRGIFRHHDLPFPGDP